MLVERDVPVRAKCCGHCGAAFDERSWRALRVVKLLCREELRDSLTKWPWPPDAQLEVRVCRCGVTLVRVLRG
jgi:hypothetical protein